VPTNIGVTGFILIIVIALILFGPNKLPELGRAFGTTIREFKRGAKEIMNIPEDISDEDEQFSQTEEERAEDNKSE